MEIYSFSIIGLAVLCLIPIILANIVGPMKGMAKTIGGPVADARDDNALYRVDRTHANSVESIPIFVLAAVLGMLAGIGAWWLGLLVWFYLAARIAYAVIYIRGGALAMGGSLRTLVHVAGSIATIGLVVATILAAL